MVIRLHGQWVKQAQAYAESLSKICPFEVKVAANGDAIDPGKILIAPGNFHLEVASNGAAYEVKLHQKAKM